MDDEIVSGQRRARRAAAWATTSTRWWVGSQLDIEETRALVPGQNATTLQVAASVLGAVFWMIDNPERGVLRARRPRHTTRSSPSPTRTSGRARRCRADWTPLLNRVDVFDGYGGRERPADEDVWQFETFLVD